MKKLILLLISLLCVSCGNTSPTQSQTQDDTLQIERAKTVEELCSEQEQLVQQQIVEEELRAQQILVEQKQAIEKILKFFDEPFNASTHCKTETTILNLINLFGTWASLIQERENTVDEDLQKLVKQLEDRASKYQATAFPILRKEYIKVLGNKVMVTHDGLGFIGGENVDYIQLSIGGSKNSSVTFDWWGLVADKNKATFMHLVLNRLTILRFTRAKLQSYEYDNEPFYFTPFKGKDTDLVVLQ